MHQQSAPAPKASGSNKDKKVGLVLGSGAVRGLSQIGIIKSLVERDVAIDMVAGTSVGAIVGACYAKMMTDNRGFRGLLSKISWDDLFKMESLNINSVMGGFFRVKRILEWLKDVFGGLAFDDLAIPLAIVATDAHTAEEVVIREGSVYDAVVASISIPALFPPLRHGKRVLVDGAFVNPIPVNVVKDMGANYLIACDTTATRDRKNMKEETRRLVKIFNRRNRTVVENAGTMFKLLKQTLHYMESGLVKTQLHKADLVITPDVADIDMLAFARGREVVMRGYAAAETALCKV